MRDITQLHPALQSKVQQLKDACTQQGLQIGFSECLRTSAEQDALYAKGRTAPGNIVTKAKGSSYSSMHQWGIAIDFYRNDGSGAYNDSDGFFTKVGQIGKSLGLEWGGDWKSIVDKPHFQLPDWGPTPTKLKQQYGTPGTFMATWGAAPAPVVRPQEVPQVSAPQPVKEPIDPRKSIIRLGQEHANNFAQCGLGLDGIRGEATKKGSVKVLQRAMNLDYKAGLTEDGIWGEKSNAALGRHTVRNGETQYMVTALEILLMLKGYDPGGLELPGIFGSSLLSAVRQYQADQGLASDGIAGANTFKSLIS